LSLDHPLSAMAIAVVVWWLATGLVLFGVRRGESGAGDWHQAGPAIWASLLAAGGLMLLVQSRESLTPIGSYAGFFGALLIWAFHEVTFLTGLLTGPRRAPCPPGLTGWQRFKAAFETVSSHELAIFITVVGIVWLLHDAGNRFGMWTFILLWVMRISAKLNIFLGAPNAISEMMPERMAYLKTYFNTGTTSYFFPVTIGAAAAVMVALVIGAWQASHEFVVVGHLLLATFMALAIIEHFVLVLPVSDRALWSWAMPEKSAESGRSIDANAANVSHGLSATVGACAPVSGAGPDPKRSRQGAE
jgi:putative photosynthetic complex assembly protein 2